MQISSGLLSKYFARFARTSRTNQVVLSTSTLVMHSQGNIENSTTPTIKAVLDPKRRNELIDEAFLEQKDILLDMLETKLKEVRDKKNSRTVNINESESSKCETMPIDVDIVLKAHGISAIGDTDVQLKYGKDGNGTLSLDATGISNVGKAHVELDVGDGNVHIPGLDKIFTGEPLLKKGCYKNKVDVVNNSSTTSVRKTHRPVLDYQQTRRVDRSEDKPNVVLPLNETSNSVEKAENNDMRNNIDINNNSSTIVPQETSNVDDVVNE